ncbi:MAG: protein kinase, partial [Pirellula sp.]
MEIQGYTLQRPLTNSVQSQAFLAKNEQGELVRLIRCFDSHNKSLAPSLERLKRAGLVKNDFILPISVASESNDELVVATRFVHDGSLFNKAQVGDQHALSIIERLADGLRSAHDKGVWHGCLSRSVIYRTGSESDDVVIDLLDLLVSKQFNATMQDESQWFAEDVLQLGNLILEIFKPESRDTTTNKQLFDLVHDMTQLDWANRPSMSEVRGRIILLQKNSPTMAGEDPSNATDATMELDADAMESMSVRAQSSKTPVQLGRFVIERQIGEGGMGTVLLGRDQSNSQRVAIKLLAQQWAGDERSTRRFEREARLLSIVKHPAIAQLIEFGRSD